NACSGGTESEPGGSGVPRSRRRRPDHGRGRAPRPGAGAHDHVDRGLLRGHLRDLLPPPGSVPRGPAARRLRWSCYRPPAVRGHAHAQADLFTRSGDRRRRGSARPPARPPHDGGGGGVDLPRPGGSRMNALPLVGFLALSSALFVLGLFGILTRRNFILVLIAIEIAMNAAILNFVYFGAFSSGTGGL